MDTPCNPGQVVLSAKPHLQCYSPTISIMALTLHLYKPGVTSASLAMGLPLPPPGPKSPCQPELQFRERAVEREGGRDDAQGAKGGQGTTAGCCLCYCYSSSLDEKHAFQMSIETL